jgi:hypothetical protein
MQKYYKRLQTQNKTKVSKDPTRECKEEKNA